MTHADLIKQYNLPANSNIFMSSEIALDLNVNDVNKTLHISERTSLRPLDGGNVSGFKIYVSDRPITLNPVRHGFKTIRQPNFELTKQNTSLMPVIIAVSLDEITDKHLETLKPYHTQLFKSRKDIIKPLDFILINTPYNNKDARESLRLAYEVPEFDKPAEYLANTIKDNTLIFFYTDSDADGVLSGASCDFTMKVIQYDNYVVKANDRHYGNGVNEHTITLLEEIMVSKDMSFDDKVVMVTADHGSSNVKAIKNMKDKFPNLSIIVTDHHNFNEANEPDVEFHLNNQASYSNLPKSYSGCVMVGLLMANLLSTMDKPLFKEHFIPLAISMISDRRDMLCGYSRLLVKYVEQGILNKEIDTTVFPAFKNINYQSNSWGWGLVPIINSGGRQSSANVALDFLCCDIHQYKKKYTPLLKLNNRRKLVQKKLKQYIINELCGTVEYETNFRFKYKAMAFYIIPYSVTLSLGFDITEVNGINGVLASMLDSYKYKPTIVLAEQPDGSYKGSGRKNIHGNFSFRAILKELSSKDLLQGGGHDGAAGVSIRKENLVTVLDAIDEYAIKADPDGYVKPSNFDILVKVKHSGKPFLNFLESFGPYGTNWETPRVKMDLSETDKIIRKPKPYLTDTIVFQNGVQCVIRAWGKQLQKYVPTGIGSATWCDDYKSMLVTER